MTQVVTAHEPVRMCIGCRKRAPAAELLRVVVASGTSGTPAPDPASGSVLLVPDPRRRAAGRGAWLHPVLACADTAVRRRAFARALRVPGPIDPAPVLDYVEQQAGQQ